MSGDGRLDLDDLGRVVENATPLGSHPGRDELAGGGEGPTWSERAAPAVAWLRRHRVAVALVTASTLVLGLGAAAWQVRQPPPPATELAVSLLFPVDRVGVEFVDDSVLRLGVRAEPRRDGETVRVLGVVGTGLAASSATSAGPGAFDVQAVVDCGLEPSLVTGTAPTEHLVEVETTDAYGRTLRGRVPMVGVSDSLGFQLSQHCAQAMTDEGVITRATTARPEGSDLTLTVSVRNDTPHRVLLAVAGQTGTVDVTAPVVGVPAGRSRFWAMRLSLTDCAAPELPWVAADGTWVEVAGYTLLDEEEYAVRDAEPVVEAQASFDSGAATQDPLASLYQGPAYRPVRLGAVIGSIRAWVRAACAGVEPVTARVRPDGPAFTVAEGPDRVAIPVTLEVGLPTAGQATIASTGDSQDTWAPRLSARDAPDQTWSETTSGPRTATYRLLYMLSCDGDLSPPRVEAVVRSRGRTTPWRIVLADAALAEALITACPFEARDVDNLAGWGWMVSDQPGATLPR